MSDMSFTKTEAATIAKLSEKSIERAIADGELSVVREHGRVMVDGASLRAWIQRRQSRGRRRSACVPFHVERAIAAEIAATAEAR